MLSQEANDTVEELDKEWVELIKMVNNLEKNRVPVKAIKVCRLRILGHKSKTTRQSFLI